MMLLRLLLRPCCWLIVLIEIRLIWGLCVHSATNIYRDWCSTLFVWYMRDLYLTRVVIILSRILHYLFILASLLSNDPLRSFLIDLIVFMLSSSSEINLGHVLMIIIMLLDLLRGTSLDDLRRLIRFLRANMGFDRSFAIIPYRVRRATSRVVLCRSLIVWATTSVVIVWSCLWKGACLTVRIRVGRRMSSLWVIVMILCTLRQWAHRHDRITIICVCLRGRREHIRGKIAVVVLSVVLSLKELEASWIRYGCWSRGTETARPIVAITQARIWILRLPRCSSGRCGWTFWGLPHHWASSILLFCIILLEAIVIVRLLVHRLILHLWELFLYLMILSLRDVLFLRHIVLSWLRVLLL